MLIEKSISFSRTILVSDKVIHRIEFKVNSALRYKKAHAHTRAYKTITKKAIRKDFNRYLNKEKSRERERKKTCVQCETIIEKTHRPNVFFCHQQTNDTDIILVKNRMNTSTHR